MVDMADIKRAARVVKDENGKPMVQIPLDLWEKVVGRVESETAMPQTSQAAQILALLKEWEQQPEHHVPDEWWDEFDTFLNENRVNFPERDLNLGDE